MQTNNCDVNAAGQWANEGCGVESTDALSYGKGFNQGGGGVIVMAWERSGIRIWSWGRSNVPGELLREGFEGENVDTSELGVVSYFRHWSTVRQTWLQPLMHNITHNN